MSDPACAVDPGDTAWMALAFLLVLLMLPGLILFESGLLRAKNSVSVAAQVMAGLPILSLLWYLFGFSLVFGTDQAGVIGSLSEHALFANTPYDDCLPKYSGATRMLFSSSSHFLCTSPVLPALAVCSSTRVATNAVLYFLL
jgi:Amt family ammonium transporter